MTEPTKPAANPAAPAVNEPTGNGQGLQRLADGSYTDPTIDPAVIDDWWWAVHERSAGSFDAFSGQHLAILEHRLIDRDRDPLALRLRVAAAQQVRPERIVVIFVDPD